MLEHTFVHIPGIGPKTEKRLWQQGVISIHELAEQLESGDIEEVHGISKPRKIIEGSIKALEEGDWNWFLEHLPAKEHWRLLDCFNNPAYLDIETTGLDPLTGHITTIGVYNGKELKSYVYEQNLDKFGDDIVNYDAVITYNGKAFDIPFIKISLKVVIDLPHIDLRYPLANLGYKGGLKKIEKAAGLHREGAMGDIDGYMAVLLWREYKSKGNENALATLIAYNLEDIINLKPLGEKAYNQHIEKLPEDFHHHMVRETTEHPEVTYAVDEALVASLQGRMY